VRVLVALCACVSNAMCVVCAVCALSLVFCVNEISVLCVQMSCTVCTSVLCVQLL